ncbi:prion protein, related sequence 3 [Myxocyprinus asiaticus]|uniref:prion protein, related sequence 3 n=1 Tax=Myxocyprinus asiaticus TaxID=70543 RepID=UPI0022232BBA|nr:prion protein, related sequence 3 [Myxocyprinus asiaticus]
MGRLTVLLLLALVVSVVSKRGGGSKGGFSWGKTGGSSNKGGTSTGNRGSSSSSKTKGSHSAPGNYPRQPQVPNQNPPTYPGRGGNPAPGGYPAQGNYPGRSGYPGQGGYPAQGSYPGGGSYPGAGGSYPNRYPGQAGGYGNPYPAGGSYPGYPSRGGSYPGGGVAGAGSYPGAAQYPYWNPNNKIMSPGYGGNYGAQGYGYGGGRSPFAQSVQNMGMAPSYKSKGFGRQAVMAAGVGAVAGMALGYGLGSFPRPHFHFHSPQEEYYYNNYMYKRYGQTPPNGNVNQNGNSQGGVPGDSGLTSADQRKGNPYDIFQNPPPQSYDNFMDKCIKRTDLLRQESRSKRFMEFSEPEATPGGELSVEGDSPSVAQEDAMSNNSTVERATSKTSTDAPSFVTSKLSETQSQPQRQTQESAAEEAKEDDDTVSIMEIGYPVLIEQMKARRCVELYMVYAEQYAEKQVQERSNINDQTNSGSGDLHGPLGHGVMLLLTSILSVIFSSLLH